MENCYIINKQELKEVFQEILNDFVTNASSTQDNALEYLTRDEAAKILKVSYPTMWRLEKENRLIPKRIGRKLMYKRSDIEEYMNK